jgi:hypothetical protein
MKSLTTKDTNHTKKIICFVLFVVNNFYFGTGSVKWR